MFGTLRGDTAYRLSDLPPARTMGTGRFCCLFAHAVCPPAKQIGELKGGQGTRVIVWGIRCGFPISTRQKLGHNGLEVCRHATSISACGTFFNYVLTTMC
jgi:hypothetical protein